MKSKLTASIDEDLMHILKSKYGTNMSEKVNELLSTGLKKEENLSIQWYRLLAKREEIEKEFTRFCGEWTKIVIEGNMKEREEAKKELENIKQKEDKKLIILKEKYDSIKGSAIWKDFLANYDEIKESFQGLINWVEKFQDEGHKIGVYQLKEFFIRFDIKYPGGAKNG